MSVERTEPFAWRPFLAPTDGVKEVLVDVYFGPGLVIFELTR